MNLGGKRESKLGMGEESTKLGLAGSFAFRIRIRFRIVFFETCFLGSLRVKTRKHVHRFLTRS